MDIGEIVQRVLEQLRRDYGITLDEERLSQLNGVEDINELKSLLNEFGLGPETVFTVLRAEEISRNETQPQIDFLTALAQKNLSQLLGEDGFKKLLSDTGFAGDPTIDPLARGGASESSVGVGRSPQEAALEVLKTRFGGDSLADITTALVGYGADSGAIANIAQTSTSAARRDPSIVIAGEEATEPGEIGPQGRQAREVLITDENNGRTLGLGVVYGVDNGFGEQIVVLLPDVTIDELSPEDRSLYENGQELRVRFGTIDPNGDFVMDPYVTDAEAATSVKGVVASNVFFKGTTDDEINQVLLAKGFVLDDEIIAGLEDPGAAFGTINIEDELAEQIAAFGGEDFLGGGDAAKVLFAQDRSGGEGGGRRLRMGQLFGEEELKAGTVDPITGERIGTIEDVTPYFRTEHVVGFFDGLDTETIGEWQQLFFEAGLGVTQSDIGNFLPGDLNDPTYIALEIAMTYSNRQGLYDGERIKDPREAVKLAARGLSTRPRNIPAFEPQTPRVKPNADEMFSVVNSYARSRYGRPLDDEMANQFVDFLFGRYDAAFDQSDLLAEREFIQDQIDLGKIPDSRQRGMVEGAPDEIFAVNPQAEFEAVFNKTFEGVDRVLEEGAEHRSLRDSLLGTVMTSRQAT